MNKGISLVDLAKLIEKQQAAKVDMIAPAKSLSMHQIGNHQELAVGEQGTFGINQTAHDQIAGRLAIPATYYKRMQSAAPQLLLANVNEWLGRSDDKRLIRTLDGNVRAFLSNSYQRIDNHEIAQVALPVLFAIPEVQIVSCEITEHRMYIQAVSPRVMRDVKVGDAVQAGVIIRNSEIGSGSVSVDTMVYRLKCLNGMVMPDAGYKARHVGRKVEDTEQLWADDTKAADDKAVLLRVRDMVAAAVDETRFAKLVGRMSELTETRVTGNPVVAVEVLSAKIGTTEAETGGILRALIEGGDLSAWGVINAVTAQAHTAQYDRAVEFEAAGGQLLHLAPTEWKRILEAA